MSELHTHTEQDSFSTSFNDVIEHARFIQGRAILFNPTHQACSGALDSCTSV